MKREIVIVGTGPVLGRDLTGQSELELELASRILTIVREPPEVWLPPRLRGREVECLASLYSNLDDRLDNYQRVTDYLLTVADTTDKLAFVTYGSPLVFDRVVSLTRSLAAARGISCRVIPNASSVDAIMAFIDESLTAIQICEARWMVANDIKIEPKMSLLIFQVGAYWTDGIPLIQDLKPDRLASLKSFLLKTYSPGHYAVFVRAPGFEGDAGYVRATELRYLDRGVAADLGNTSLYIPAVGVGTDGTNFWNRMRHDEESNTAVIEWS